MFLINHVTPEKAEGAVAEVYSMFPPERGVPHSLQIFSASPEMLTRQAEIIKYVSAHPNIDFPVGAAIRFLAASHFGHDYCINLNGDMLKATGVTDEQLAQLAENPSCVFEDKDAALLTFVIKAVATPTEVGQKDVDAARNAGWTDADLFDAVAMGAMMSAAGVVYKTFLK